MGAEQEDSNNLKSDTRDSTENDLDINMTFDQSRKGGSIHLFLKHLY